MFLITIHQTWMMIRGIGEMMENVRSDWLLVEKKPTVSVKASLTRTQANVTATCVSRLLHWTTGMGAIRNGTIVTAVLARRLKRRTKRKKKSERKKKNLLGWPPTFLKNLAAVS